MAATFKSRLLDHITATLEREEYLVTSERNACIQRQGKLLIDIFENEERHVQAEEFTVKLMCSLETLVLSHKKKERMLTAFYQFRVSQLSKLWKSFLSEIGIHETIDPLLYQTVSQEIFQYYYLEKMKQLQNDEGSKGRPVTESVTVDEENVIRYIGGYIPHKILQKLQKSKSSPVKISKFTDCLIKMAVEGPEESLLSYTTEWIRRIDRGNLFNISEETFMLFRALEVKFRQTYMPIITQPPSSSTSKEDVIQHFIDDEVISFHWELLAIDIDSEDDSEELLKQIVDMWINIRSFSTLNKIMEDTKIKRRTQTKKKVKASAPKTSYKKRGLRRSLLQSYKDT